MLVPEFFNTIGGFRPFGDAAEYDRSGAISGH
jgi:hypothetical protein